MISTCRGDPSADFRFATFFPEVIQGPIDRLAGMCATVFRLQVSENSNTSAAVTLHGKPLPGSDSNEAARRRYPHIFQNSSITIDDFLLICDSWQHLLLKFVENYDLFSRLRGRVLQTSSIKSLIACCLQKRKISRVVNQYAQIVDVWWVSSGFNFI